MARFRKKSGEVDTLQWLGTNQREMHDFITGDVDSYIETSGEGFLIDHSKGAGGLVIKTIHNDQEVFVEIGDWVLAEKDGVHFYPCKKDEFPNLYEEI